MPSVPVSAPLLFIEARGLIRTAAMMPGMMMMKGMNILGNDPMIGARRAEFMSFEAMARCTSTKLVVQYPKDSTKPSPKTIPTTDQKDELYVVIVVPGQESSWSLVPADDILSCRPLQPPISWSASKVSGSSAATITKNCRTSL